MESYHLSDGEIKVLTGTCGWTDDTLVRCKRFYPASAKTATDRLRHYSRYYPCVEIDTSTYAIPRPHQIKEWMDVVPKGFLFHIKIFGLFPSRSINSSAMPRDLRATHLTPELEAQPNVKLTQLTPEFIDALWTRMNDAIQVLYDGRKLGVVVFQFHTNFEPNADTVAYVAECRQRLRPQFSMAVEFRSRLWYSIKQLMVSPSSLCFPGDPSILVPSFPHQKAATLYLFRRLNIINIPSDDLVVEMPAHDPVQPSYRDGRVFIYDEVTSPDAVYIRLHRRRGEDRVLSAAELADWAARIQRMAETATKCFYWPDPFDDAHDKHAPDASTMNVRSAPHDDPLTWTHLKGPIFFMVGTDWEDQPMINLKGLSDAVAAQRPLTDPSLPKAVMLDWRAQAKQEDSKTGLQAFFGAKKPAPTAEASAAGEKRARDTDTTLPAEKKPRTDSDEVTAAAPPVAAVAASNATLAMAGPAAPSSVDAEEDDAIIVSSPARQQMSAKPATPIKKTAKPAGTLPITSFFAKR